MSSIKQLKSAMSQAASDYLQNSGRKVFPPREHTRFIVNVQNDRWALADWKDAADDPDIEAAILDIYLGDVKNQEERPGYENGPELIRDVFMIFLKTVPRLHKKREVKKDARLNGKFIEKIMELDEYDTLHDITHTDPLAAKEAVLLLVDAIKEMIKEHREQVEESNDRKEGDGTGEGQSSPGDSWDEETKRPENKGDPQQDNSDGDQEPSDQEDQNQGEQEFDEDYLENEYEEDEREWDEKLEEVDVASQINGPLKNASDEMASLNEALRGIGIESGEWSRMDPSARQKIANLLKGNQKLKDIANLVGKMKRYAMAQQATKIIDSPHEITSIEMGNDIRRVLSCEFALLGRPETKIEFYRRFIEGSLLLHKERGKENIAKGPIICLIDNSGSMSGNPENWAKGVAEALRRICQEQGRDFYVIFFGTNRDRLRYEFPKGRGPLDKILDFLSVQANWGTEFDGILTEGLQKCQTHYKENNEIKADIVFITDGQANLSKQWVDSFNKERKEIGIRVFSIYISAYDSERSSAVELLKSFSDVTVPVAALTIDDDSTSQLFSLV